jgi:hypothetical protein
MLTAEELLAGGELTFEIAVPDQVLCPGGDTGAKDGPRAVRLRPLQIKDLQRISRAAKENGDMVAVLMVQRSLVEPEMTVPKVMGLHLGLLQFLLREVNRVSGIDVPAQTIAASSESPLVKAAFVLAKEFGWTPEQFSQLTLGQVLLHLQKLAQE